MSITATNHFLVHCDTGQRYAIRAEVVIGQRKGEIVFAQDPTLSPRHCRLKLTPGGLTLEDLDSTLGTTVNDRRIRPRQPQVILPGDVIRVGQQSLRFESVAIAQKLPPRKRRRKSRSNSSRARTNGPEQLAGHLLLATLVATFLAQVWQGFPYAGASLEQLIHFGAASNPVTLNGHWWRLFTAIFLHNGLGHLICEVWLLASLTPPVARMTGGRSLLLIFFFSGIVAGLAGLAFFPAGMPIFGSGGAVAGMGGAWLVLERQGRVKRRHLSAGTMPALITVAIYSSIFAVSGLEPLLLAFGLLAGALAMVVLDMAHAERGLVNQIQVALGLLLLSTGLGIFIPHKSADNSADGQIKSPYEIVEVDLNRTMSTYEQLGRAVQSHQIDDAHMAEIIRNDLSPHLKRVKAELEVLKPDSESLRRKIELDRKLVSALLAQVTAMARFNASKDPKENELVEKWTAEIEKLSVEWKREKAARLPANH